MLYATLKVKLLGMKNSPFSCSIFNLILMILSIFSYKYNNEENELLHTLNHHRNKACRSLTFNKTGSLLLSASKDKRIVLTDTTTMTVTQDFKKAHEY